MPDFSKDIDTNVLDKDIDKIQDRELKKSITEQLIKYKTQLKTYAVALNSISKPMDDELTLDCVLNTIDGVMELHDAMMIFTDNHIDELDPAFTRAGRINYKLELKLATVKVVQDMMKNKFKYTTIEMDTFIETNSEKFKLMKDYLISPADVQNICFKYTSDEIELCLGEILEKTKIIYDSMISPADVQNICFKYTVDEIELCLDQILERTKIIYDSNI